MKSEAAEVAVATLATKTTYVTGVASAVIGYLGSNGFAVTFGVIVTMATFIVNSYYKRKDDVRKLRREAREQAVADAYIRKLERNSGMAPLMDLGDDE